MLVQVSDWDWHNCTIWVYKYYTWALVIPVNGLIVLESLPYPKIQSLLHQGPSLIDNKRKMCSEWYNLPQILGHSEGRGGGTPHNDGTLFVRATGTQISTTLSQTTGGKNAFNYNKIIFPNTWSIYAFLWVDSIYLVFFFLSKSEREQYYGCFSPRWGIICTCSTEMLRVGLHSDKSPVGHPPLFHRS